VGEHPIGNRAVRAELPSNPKRLIGCASQSTVRGTGGALVYGTIARVTWPAAMKTARQTRSARNKAAHAARIAEARPNPPARTAQIDPLDEEPMRPALRAIPWNKVALTGEQRAAVSQAILDHYPRNEIARALGITVRTLKRLINDDPSLTDAADAAKDQEEAELRDCLMEMARKGDTVAALFLLKSRHGYVDRPDLKAKPDGFQGGVLMERRGAHAPRRPDLHRLRRRAHGEGAAGRPPAEVVIPAAALRRPSPRMSWTTPARRPDGTRRKSP
jgi:hypothetical protein